MFSLWSLFKAVLLVLNALCILHRDRFLRKGTRIRTPPVLLFVFGSDGLALSTSYSFIATVCSSPTARSVLEVGLGEIDSSLGATSPKNQVAGLLQAVQYMKGMHS